MSKTNNNIIHICYDWAQNVSIPHSPQQIGATYFKTAFAAHIFSVCSTGNINRQLNFIVGENEFPVGIAKGANTTLNMVFHSLNEFKKNEKKLLKITCDNCGGQNKNNLSLWFWLWLIIIGWFDEIELNFMIPGHTKFVCDGYFGNFKKLYYKNKINTVNDVEQIINISTTANEAVRYNEGSGWIWYDFTSFLSPHFKGLPGITKYYHFWFSKSELGKVYCSKESGGEEVPFVLLLNNNCNFNQLPSILNTQPLTLKRQWYLYNKIRQYVDKEFKDVLCPLPTSNNEDI